MHKKINNKFFLLIILILFISVKYDFFLNTYSLTKTNYQNRMINVYGDCSKEGYGFTKYIYEKYKPEHNLSTINGQSKTYVNTDGFFYNKEKIFSNKFKILINYDEDVSKNFKDFEILETKKNCYLIKRIND
jgi:hypothetical protein